jgi:CHAT domain-containing protein
MKIFFLVERCFSLVLLLTLLTGAGVFSTARAAALTREAAAAKEESAKQTASAWSDEAYRRAVVLYSEAAADWTRLNEPVKAAGCHREAAKIAQLSSDYETAFAALRNSLKLSEKAADDDGKIISLSLLSLLSRQKGNAGDSENYYQRAIELSRDSVSDRARGYAALSGGMYNFYNGSPTITLEFFERAVALSSQTEDIYLISQSLFYLGFSKGRDGNPFDGAVQMEKALWKCREAGYRRGEALAFFGIGFMAMLTEEKQKALDAYREAEKLFPSDFEWLERAKLYNSIAAVYAEFGGLDMEEIYRERALEFYRKADYPFGELASLPSLAKLKYLKGDKVGSEQLYADAAALAQRLQNEFYLAVINEDLGDLSLADGLYDAAVDYYRRAQKGGYRGLKTNLPGVENRLGVAHEKKGDFGAARKFYESAFEKNIKSRDTLSAAENLFNLARLDSADGNFEYALKRITESLLMTENLYNNVNNNKLRGSYFSNAAERYEKYIFLLMKMHARSPDGDFAVRALQAAERARARTMVEKLALADTDFTKDAAPETLRREKEIRVLLNSKADHLTDLLSNGGEKTETDKISLEISALENELEEIRAGLKQQSPIYSSIKNPAPFDLADFQQNVLDDDSLLLEFSFGAQESYLWLVGKNEIGAYVLPPRAEIEGRIENLRALLNERDLKPDEAIEDFQRRISEAEAKFNLEAEELSHRLLGQIAGKLGKKRLIVVPDGKLHYFPLAALPNPDSGSKEPILLTNETVYEPSAQTLAFLVKNRQQTESATKGLLVFSDPVFNFDDPRLASGNRSFKAEAKAETAPTDRFRFVESLNNLTRLAASKNESETIVETIGAGLAESYSGFAATRETFLNLKIGDYKILHFATHGLTDEERPELSGIVLSRFNELGQQLNESVRIQDIYALDLNAELVVLSACETGVGKHVKGEGLMSLNNAFLQTGAKSVVSSLWKVEDGATLELMRNFYGAMARENLPPAQALRRAQIKLRETARYRSPFYWAAFTVQGDFRRAPQISGASYFYWLYLLPVLPFALTGFYFYRRKKAVRKAALSS